MVLSVSPVSSAIATAVGAITAAAVAVDAATAVDAVVTIKY